MEIIDVSNEHTPLLENDSMSNQHSQLTRNFATYNRPSPNGSTCSGHDAPSNLDERHVGISVPRNVEQETTDEVSLEEVAQALCSAWSPNKQYEDDVTLEFFREKELYIMHLAWKKVTRGRHCKAEPHVIAEAVAAAIAADLYTRPEYSDISDDILLSWDLDFHANKDLLAVNLLRNWERIIDGSTFPLRYTRTVFEDSDEQTRAVSEFWVRQVDLYDKIHDFIFDSNFQFFLHTLLFIWPISILTVGAKFMECSMGHHLSYLLMMLGGVGCLTVLVRLALIHGTSGSQCPEMWFRAWIYLRFIEFAFFIVFIVQAVHLFNTDPETEPDPNQCVENFYSVALMVNYVSMPFISAYVFVYFIKIFLKCFNPWNWIL